MTEQGPHQQWGSPPQPGNPQGSPGATAWSDPNSGQAPGSQGEWHHPGQSGPPPDQRWSPPQPQWRPAGDAGTGPPARSLAGLRTILQLAVPVLVVVALLLTEDGAESNAFEEVTAWSVGAVGTAGLVGYWVIIALPGVSSNAGFMLTLAAACAVIGCWLSPGRRV